MRPFLLGKGAFKIGFLFWCRHRKENDWFRKELSQQLSGACKNKSCGTASMRFFAFLSLAY